MIRSVGVEELLSIVRSGGADPETPGGRVHIFDLRDGGAHQVGHIPGARHLPLESVLRWTPQRVSTLELIVLLDDDGALGGPARRAAAKLAHKWFTRVRFLAGGQRAWLAASGPIERGGPVGIGASSYDGAREEFQRSRSVRWTTPATVGRP